MAAKPKIFRDFPERRRAAVAIDMLRDAVEDALLVGGQALALIRTNVRRLRAVCNRRLCRLGEGLAWISVIPAKPESIAPSFRRRPESNSPSFRRRPESSSPSFRRKPESSSPSFRRKPESSSPSFRRKPESILILLLRSSAQRENRLTSLCYFVRHPGGRVTFFCLSKRKSTKEKDTLASAVAGIHARGLREQARGSPTVRPCTDVELAGILPAIAVATFPSPARRGREGPGKSKSAAVPAAEARRSFFALGVPLKPRRRADGSAACTARGRREGSRRFGCRPWMACQPNPSARSEPSP